MASVSRREFVSGALAVSGAMHLSLEGQTQQRGNTAKALPPVHVHADGHMLQTADGAPFFWLADTAWELIHSTTRDECSYYLQTRAAQGFNVIQAVVLGELDGVRKPTPLGLLPFHDENASRPNDAYFARVVEIVEEAARRGLYVALLPTWGDKLTASWGKGPVLFRGDNLPVARGYAAYLAGRLKHCSNVLWMLGGDRPPRIDARFHATAVRFNIPEVQDWTAIWDAMADGIASVWPTKPLFLYHPQGGANSTSVMMAESKWLNVNGIQSGHGSGHDAHTWELIARDYAASPRRPTIDLEPNYEDHPVNPWPAWNPANGYFRDHDVRKQLYRSVFAGGCGVTYGHHAVWQFASARNGLLNHADRDWMSALVRPGAQQAVYLRRLILSRPFFERVPDPSMLETVFSSDFEHAVATRDAHGSYAMVYVPNASQTIALNLSRLKAGKRMGWWFDPQTGMGERMEADVSGARVELRTPMRGVDWVAVIDAEEFGPPGIVG